MKDGGPGRFAHLGHAHNWPWLENINLRGRWPLDSMEKEGIGIKKVVSWKWIP